MHASEVISSLQRRGVILKIVDGSLKIGGVNQLTDREKAALKAHKAGIIKALSQPTATPATAPLAPALAATAALPTCTELPEPAPKDRRCYQCEHFARSPYGFPVGLCRQHGMPAGVFSEVRGNRVQHATSSPAQFGCISFQLRAPDTDVCTVCRHYHPVSTMCRAVNTGCPSLAIPPCRGESFEPKEVWP